MTDAGSGIATASTAGDEPGAAPRLTVVIPTYNRRNVLARTLRLLDRQDRRVFDVVVVDDGSTDGSADAVEALRPELGYALTLIRQSNGGAACARNAGVRAARGAVTLLIGDDTLPRSDLVGRHLAHHDAHPGLCEAALGLTRWCETSQRVNRYMRWAGAYGIQFHYAHLLAGGEADWHHFYTSNLSLKTAQLRANPFAEDFPGAAIEDIELGYRLQHGPGLRMSFLPDAVVDHVHPMTFRGGCRRQETVGACTLLFDRMRGHDQSGRLRTTGWHRWVRDYGWFRACLAWLGELALLIRCPNPISDRVLWLHFQTGYERAAERSPGGLPQRGVCPHALEEAARA